VGFGCDDVFGGPGLRELCPASQPSAAGGAGQVRCLLGGGCRSRLIAGCKHRLGHGKDWQRGEGAAAGPLTARRAADRSRWASASR